jgi:hypothetical protein
MSTAPSVQSRRYHGCTVYWRGDPGLSLEAIAAQDHIVHWHGERFALKRPDGLFYISLAAALESLEDPTPV